MARNISDLLEKRFYTIDPLKGTWEPSWIHGPRFENYYVRPDADFRLERWEIDSSPLVIGVQGDMAEGGDVGGEDGGESGRPSTHRTLAEDQVSRENLILGLRPLVGPFHPPHSRVVTCDLLLLFSLAGHHT